jgi:hypothetical protein
MAEREDAVESHCHCLSMQLNCLLGQRNGIEVLCYDSPHLFPSITSMPLRCHRPVTTMTLMAIVLQALALLAFTLALMDLVLLVRIILYFLLFHRQLLVLFPQ